MDIRKLKEECNQLIDEILELSGLEENLDNQILQLEQEIALFGLGKDGMLEPEMADDPVPEYVPEFELELGVEFGSESEPEFELERETEPEFGLEREMEPEFESETEAEPELEKECDQNREPETAYGKEMQENLEECAETEVSEPKEKPELQPKSEEILRNQVALICDNPEKDIVIVYEKSAGLQKVLDVIKTLFFIIIMILFVAAAVLLLYWQFEKGAG